MFYTYIIKSEKSGRLYTGFTSDLRKRLSRHYSNESGYTKKRGPYKLIYYEACLNRKDAWAREKYLKTGMGKRFVTNRLKHFLTLTG